MIHTYAQASGNLFAGNSKARLCPSFFGEIQSFFFVGKTKSVSISIGLFSSPSTSSHELSVGVHICF